MSVDNSSLGPRHTRLAQSLGLAVAVVLTIVLGLMLPGLGLVVAAGFAFTVWRNDRAVKKALLALGLAVTLIAIVMTAIARFPGTTQTQHTKPVIVRPNKR